MSEAMLQLKLEVKRQLYKKQLFGSHMLQR